MLVWDLVQKIEKTQEIYICFCGVTIWNGRAGDLTRETWFYSWYEFVDSVELSTDNAIIINAMLDGGEDN